MTAKGPKSVSSSPEATASPKKGWLERKADSWAESFKHSAFYKNLAKVFFYGLFFISLLALPGLGPLIAKGIGGIFNILPFKAVGEISGVITNTLMSIGKGFLDFLGILGKNTTDAFVLLGVTTAGSLVGSKITWSAQNKLDADAKVEEERAAAAEEQKKKGEDPAATAEVELEKKKSATRSMGAASAAKAKEEEEETTPTASGRATPPPAYTPPSSSATPPSSRHPTPSHTGGDGGE